MGSRRTLEAVAHLRSAILLALVATACTAPPERGQEGLEGVELRVAHIEILGPG